MLIPLLHNFLEASIVDEVLSRFCKVAEHAHVPLILRHWKVSKLLKNHHKTCFVLTAIYMPCPQSIYKFKSFFAKLRSLHTSFRLLRLLCLSGWFPIGDLQRTITWDASIGCGTGISMWWSILGWACARPRSAGARRDRWHGRGMGSLSILRHLHSPGAKESCLKNEMACFFFWMVFPYSAFFLKQIWRNCVFVYFSPFDYESFLFNISVFQIENLWASNIKFLSGTLRQDLGRLARSWQCFQQISNR